MEDLTPQRPITADVARDILRRFITEEQVKQRFAAKNRKAMHESIAAGVNPSGHRAEWICSAVASLVDQLMEKAEEFNKTYPYDIVLLGDYLDILATTKSRFLAAAGINEESDG